MHFQTCGSLSSPSTSKEGSSTPSFQGCGRTQSSPGLSWNRKTRCSMAHSQGCSAFVSTSLLRFLAVPTQKNSTGGCQCFLRSCDGTDCNTSDIGSASTSKEKGSFGQRTFSLGSRRQNCGRESLADSFARCKTRWWQNAVRRQQRKCSKRCWTEMRGETLPGALKSFAHARGRKK